MFMRIMSAILSLSLLINPVYAQESETDNTFEIPMVWEPGELKTSLGDYELTVHILPVRDMPTPHAGYLILKTDWREIKRRLDRWAQEVERIRTEERTVCSGLLADKDRACQDLNRDLRNTIDTQNEKIVLLNTNIGDLRDDIFWWKIGAGATAVLALSFGIFAISK